MNSISTSAGVSDNRTLAEIVSSVPPVPPAELARIAETPYGQRHKGSWEIGNHNVPQIITALVLIEQSPAGKAWGVELATMIPSEPSDTRYSNGCASGWYYTQAYALVEGFFIKSKLAESAPKANVQWANTELLGKSNGYGVEFSCNAVLRMLHAAQELHDQALRMQSAHRTELEEAQRSIHAMGKKITELEGRITILNSEVKQLQATDALPNHAPAVTCLMYLFAGYMPGTPAVDELGDEIIPSLPSPDTAHTRQTRPPTGSRALSTHTNLILSIAPHTDRLSNLRPDAQKWFWDQLDTRTIWVSVTDPDSKTNHISWTQFEGAVEMGKSVVFSYGNYRFW